LLVKTLAAYGRAYKYIDGPSSQQEWIKAYKEGVGPVMPRFWPGGAPLGKPRSEPKRARREELLDADRAREKLLRLEIS
jgi:hypothetical protein